MVFSRGGGATNVFFKKNIPKMQFLGFFGKFLIKKIRFSARLPFKISMYWKILGFVGRKSIS